MKVLPVTVISGFAGAGKTTLIKRLMASKEGEKMALITSALGQGDVDAGLCESNTKDGSILCKSREHLGMELRKAGRARAWDRVLIESTAASEPLPIADLIVLDDGRGTPISRYVKIDALITVVDAERFLADFASTESLSERGFATSQVDARCVVELHAAHVEYADILIVYRPNSLDEASFARALSMLRALSPRAKIIVGSPSEVELDGLLDTGLFDLDAMKGAVGLERESGSSSVPAEAPFVVLAYRRFLPFHPARFEAFAHGEKAGILRAKGVYWVASRHDSAGEWSLVGKVVHHAVSGSFWAATPVSEWNVSDERKAKIKSLWQEPFGDRRQDLVFVVQATHRDELVARLDACLLTPEEMALGPAGWRALGGALHEEAAHHHEHGNGHEHEHGNGHGHDQERFSGHTPAGGHHSN